MRSWAFVVAGLALIFAGVALMAASTVAGAQPPGLSYGGVLLIGPIPVIFGGGPYGLQMVILAAALGVVLLALSLVLLFAAPSPGDSEGGGDEEGEN